MPYRNDFAKVRNCNDLLFQRLCNEVLCWRSLQFSPNLPVLILHQEHLKGCNAVRRRAVSTFRDAQAEYKQPSSEFVPYIIHTVPLSFSSS